MINGPLVYIIGDSDLLIKELEEGIKEKGCNLLVVTDLDKLKEEADYVILMAGFSEKEKFSKETIVKYLEYIKQTVAKSEVVLPYSPKEKFEYISFIEKEARNRGIQIVYLGELYGEGVVTSFAPFWMKGELRTPKYDFDVYLLSVKKAAYSLIKGILSYGFSKEEIVVTSKIRAFDFIKRVKETNPLESMGYGEEAISQGTMPCFDFEEVSIEKEELSKTIKWLKEQAIKMPQIKEKKIKKKLEIKLPKIKLPHKKVMRYLFIFGVLFFWIFSVPFLILFSSTVFMRAGFERLMKFDFDKSAIYFSVSASLAEVAGKSFVYYDEGKNVSIGVDDFSGIGKELGKSMLLGKELVEKIQKGESYDVSGVTSSLYLKMDLLHRQILLLSGNKKIANFLPDFNFEEIGFYLGHGKKIVKELPLLLGSEKKTNYMVLVQDAAELRPSGGKIESFGIFTFEKGVLTSKAFYSTDSVDNKLKGFVNPPSALKQYLNITNWNLANSNWDPDFGASASRAGWFFEKETGEKVDGVIGVSKNLFNNIINFEGNLWEWGAKIIENLQTKEVQFYVGDNGVGDELKALNWDGGVGGLTCMGNCQVNLVGIVEANVGNNKVNPDIVRDVKWEVKVDSTLIKNRLTVNYYNSSNSEKYRNYLRVLTSAEAGFLGKGSEVFVEILPGEKEEVIFVWENKRYVEIDKAGKLILTVRKQSGVTLTPTSIQVDGLTNEGLRRYNTNLYRDFSTEIEW